MECVPVVVVEGPIDAAVRYAEACGLAGQGKHAQARRIYPELDAALANVDSEVRVRALIRNDLAVLAVADGRFDEARAGWRGALDADPDCLVARLNRDLLEAEISLATMKNDVGELKLAPAPGAAPVAGQHGAGIFANEQFLREDSSPSVQSSAMVLPGSPPSVQSSATVMRGSPRSVQSSAVVLPTSTLTPLCSIIGDGYAGFTPLCSIIGSGPAGFTPLCSIIGDGYAGFTPLCSIIGSGPAGFTPLCSIIGDGYAGFTPPNPPFTRGGK